MKKNAFILLISILISGCATTDWNQFMYGNPNGQSFAYGCVCEKCNRVFNVNVIANQNLPSDVTCPYCGQTQNLQYALNRYTYLAQQQNTNPDIVSAIGQSLRAGAQEQTQNQQKVIDYMLTKPDSGYSRPNYAPNPYRNDYSRTECHYDAMGRLICSTSGNGGYSRTVCHTDAMDQIICNTD